MLRQELEESNLNLTFEEDVLEEDEVLGDITPARSRCGSVKYLSGATTTSGMWNSIKNDKHSKKIQYLENVGFHSITSKTFFTTSQHLYSVTYASIPILLAVLYFLLIVLILEFFRVPEILAKYCFNFESKIYNFFWNSYQKYTAKKL